MLSLFTDKIYLSLCKKAVCQVSHYASLYTNHWKSRKNATGRGLEIVHAYVLIMSKAPNVSLRMASGGAGSSSFLL